MFFPVEARPDVLLFDNFCFLEYSKFEIQKKIFYAAGQPLNYYIVAAMKFNKYFLKGSQYSTDHKNWIEILVGHFKSKFYLVDTWEKYLFGDIQGQFF